MRKSRFSESQIIGIVKEHEAGAKVANLTRRHGISAPTLYNWMLSLTLIIGAKKMPG